MLPINIAKIEQQVPFCLRLFFSQFHCPLCTYLLFFNNLECLYASPSISRAYWKKFPWYFYFLVQKWVSFTYNLVCIIIILNYFFIYLPFFVYLFHRWFFFSQYCGSNLRFFSLRGYHIRLLFVFSIKNDTQLVEELF